MESGTQVPLTDSLSADPGFTTNSVLTQKQSTQQLIHLARNVATTAPSSIPVAIIAPSAGSRKSFSVQQRGQNDPLNNSTNETGPTKTTASLSKVTVTAQQQFCNQQGGIHTRSMTGRRNPCQSQTGSPPDVSAHRISDSDAARQEAHTIYPSMQLVPSGEFSSDMFYTTSGAGGSGHHPAHHLQSGAATYSVYGDAGGGAYSPQIYYQNSNLAYQQSLHSPGSTYSVHGQHPGSVIGVHEDDGAAQQLSHTTRASPATIQWLLQNYETAEGVSLPRCTLYGHYLKHCGEHKLDPVNAASFGKLIRSVFLGLRTRRLGTRGNSKYHYYGIRIKPDSPLNKISDDNMTMAMRQQPSNPTRRLRGIISTPSGHSPGSMPASRPPPPHGGASSADVGVGADVVPIEEHHKHFLGVGMVPNILPPSAVILEANLQRVGLSFQQVEKFFAGYRQHCEDILEYVKNLMFNNVDCCWRQFWQAEETSPLDDGDDQSNRSYSSDINLTGLSRNQLYTLCTLQPVLEYIQTMDFHFYQVIANVLIPNVLKPMPSALTQSVRNFAKKLESCLAVALQGAPEVVVKIKLDAVCSLAQTVRRYTSLNHLAQAARAVLQNPAQISQMLTDLNRVDFRNVHEQASWVCYCSSVQVEEIEKSFKATLEGQKSLEEWACWLENVVDRVLSSVCNRPYHELIHFAQQFLLKWSFYSSMVMRDLTLRSAPSFGSFHLIRLLFDEYTFYLIEQRVARASGQTTVAIMSQSYRHHVEIEELDSYHGVAASFSADHHQHLAPQSHVTHQQHHDQPPPPPPPPQHHHHHHHQHDPVAFVAGDHQFQQIVNTANGDNVVVTPTGGGDNIMSNESVAAGGGGSQIGLDHTPGSVDVEDYAHDPSGQFFALTSSEQNECGAIGEIEPPDVKSPGAFSHCSPENLSANRIRPAAAPAVVDESSSTSMASVIDQKVFLENSVAVVIGVRRSADSADLDDDGDEDGSQSTECKKHRVA